MSTSHSFLTDDVVRVMETEYSWWGYRNLIHKEGTIVSNPEPNVYRVEFVEDGKFHQEDIRKADLHKVGESAIEWDSWAEAQYQSMMDDYGPEGK